MSMMKLGVYLLSLKEFILKSEHPIWNW